MRNCYIKHNSHEKIKENEEVIYKQKEKPKLNNDI